MNYRDRAGKEYKVSTSQDRFLRFLYTNRMGKHLLKFMISDKLTRLIELYMNTRISTLKIDPFIKENKINISDYEKKFYTSYNDFFTRK
ncbi:MAG: phosphatidylserine decarboxylase, partial [Lachnospiraceae bacterium]|nr:phosphatidylserine decarboxylase [Lachnospiraceae bacterium]